MSYLATARRVLNEQTREAENATKETKKVPATRCAECGDPIAPDEPECWWGLDRVHLSCGKNAWRREWKGEAPPAEAAAAH